MNILGHVSESLETSFWVYLDSLMRIGDPEIILTWDPGWNEPSNLLIHRQIVSPALQFQSCQFGFSQCHCCGTRICLSEDKNRVNNGSKRVKNFETVADCIPNLKLFKHFFILFY
jgi:hypothetical protein